MNRRACLHRLTILALTGTAISRALAAADGAANLRDTLRLGLRCRRPEENAFVDLVVTKVEEGKLPTSLVLNLFEYARTRRPTLPFPYFQAAIRKAAASIGVEL